MENTESLEPIQDFVDFEVLNANEQKITGAERYWTLEGTAESTQPRNCGNVLIQKCKSKNVLHWGKGFAFIFTENVNLWFLFRLKMIKFERERLPENCNYRH